jgi:hypothetical protein
MSYIDTLIDNCKKAQGALAAQELVLDDLGDLSLLDGIKNAVYVMEHDGEPEQTFREFSMFKATSDRKCARLNARSSVLYVGSSITGLRRRINDHMGRGPASRYALHLDHWFLGKLKLTVRVYDEAAAVIQIIEDDLSDRLKPAFGKPGANNR